MGRRDDLTIAHVHARQVLDSRGRPTVEVDVVLRGGARGEPSCPRALPQDVSRRWSCVTATAHYAGRGVRQAVANVNEVLGPAVIGRSALDQQGLDAILTGARRPPRQVTAGRERYSRRLTGNGARGRAGTWAASVPLYWRYHRVRTARPDGQYHQRWPARRPHAGYSGLSGHPARRAHLQSRRWRWP